MKKYYCLFVAIVILVSSSCVRKRDCNIEPISLGIMDTFNLKGDFIFKNQKGEIDSLLLTNYYKILTDQEIKAIANSEKCGHLIGFDYNSDKNGTLEISLNKSENKEYSFLLSGYCISKDFPMNQKEVNRDSMLIVKVDSCENSKFKELAFRKFKLEYYITQDGDIWKPIKFIPRELKK